MEEHVCAPKLVALETLPLGLADLQTLCSQSKLVLAGFGAVPLIAPLLNAGKRGTRGFEVMRVVFCHRMIPWHVLIFNTIDLKRFKGGQQTCCGEGFCTWDVLLVG